jgi:hypothetical protein
LLVESAFADGVLEDLVLGAHAPDIFDCKFDSVHEFSMGFQLLQLNVQNAVDWLHFHGLVGFALADVQVFWVFEVDSSEFIIFPEYYLILLETHIDTIVQRYVEFDEAERYA